MTQRADPSLFPVLGSRWRYKRREWEVVNHLDGIVVLRSPDGYASYCPVRKFEGLFKTLNET